MFNILICEMKKIKRIWILLIIGVFIMINVSTAPVNTATIKNADQLFTWINMTVFSYGFLSAINILTAYMFILEFKNNTMSVMVTYRHERWKIFISKIIAIILVSLLLYIVEFIMLTCMSFVLFRDTLTLAVLAKHFIITIRSFGFQMLMITVTACIALVSKNITSTIMYIAVQLVASYIFLSYPQVRAFIPFPLPVVSNLMLIRDSYKIIRNISIMPSEVIIAVVMFVGGIAYGCWYMNKMEIS